MSDRSGYPPEIQSLSNKEKSLLNDLLSIVEVAASNRYMALDSQRELNAYVIYMMYRVQQDLYTVCQENGQFRDLSWDDFVLLLRGNIPARVAAIVVVRETLNNFYRNGHYNFDVTEINFNYGPDAGNDETGFLHCSQLFPNEEGLGHVENLLFHAELAQYGRLLNQHTGCSWEQFLDELAQKGPLWSQVLAAFQDALARLDFKPVWKSEELEELVWQAATEED